MLNPPINDQELKQLFSLLKKLDETIQIQTPYRKDGKRVTYINPLFSQVDSLISSLNTQLKRHYQFTLNR